MVSSSILLSFHEFWMILADLFCSSPFPYCFDCLHMFCCRSLISIELNSRSLIFFCFLFCCFHIFWIFYGSLFVAESCWLLLHLVFVFHCFLCFLLLLGVRKQTRLYESPRAVTRLTVYRPRRVWVDFPLPWKIPKFVLDGSIFPGWSIKRSIVWSYSRLISIPLDCPRGARPGRLVGLVGPKAPN